MQKYLKQKAANITCIKKMLESRPEDALVKLLNTVEIVDFYLLGLACVH